MENNIKTVFHWTNLALDDYKKLIDANYPKGHSPNFVIARIGLVTTESLAKLSYPYRNGNIPNRFDQIEAKPSVQYFFQEFFSNTRYAQIAYFLWDTYRNALVHQSSLKKIINVPIDEIENSFLAGVHISSSTTMKLENDKRKKKFEENEHLQFYTIINKKGITRPIFRFSPIIYYFDLKEAVKNYKNRLSSDKVLRNRFRRAYPLFQESLRLDFQNRDRVPQNEYSLILKEARELIQ